MLIESQGKIYDLRVVPHFSGSFDYIDFRRLCLEIKKHEYFIA
jgi:hypothetical protein